MGCLAYSARRRLQLLAPELKIGEWTRVEGVLPGPEIRALRTGQARLEQIEPFRLAAEGFAATTQDRARLTIVVVQTRIAERAEFLILAWRVSAAAETAEQVAVPCSDRANAAGPR
jgi:CDP-diacylglycerol pyrophosphatase